ncbi:MAG: ABC transporter permease [Clostridia bacterium]|nr:ABC transporter permease [Clostridia bacterium]
MNKKRSFLQSISAAPHMVWAVLFIVTPMLFVLYYAFTKEGGGFSFENFTNLFQAIYVSTFVRSLCYALIATVICLLLAYPLAYILAKLGEGRQSLMITLLMLPMWINFIIRTNSLISIVHILGFFGTPVSVILGMVYNYLPYMILPIYTVLSKIDRRYLEASMDLGCTPLQTILKVVLPLSISGVISGITMVFVPSVSTFYISTALGGNKTTLIGDMIESRFLGSSGAINYYMGAMLSLILMILIFISMWVMNRFSDEKDGGVIV